MNEHLRKECKLLKAIQGINLPIYDVIWGGFQNNRMTVQVGYDFAKTSGGNGASETTPPTKQGQERHLGRTAQSLTN